MISKLLQILDLQPQVFLHHYNNFSHIRPEQFWKQNTISQLVINILPKSSKCIHIPYKGNRKSFFDLYICPLNQCHDRSGTQTKQCNFLHCKKSCNLFGTKVTRSHNKVGKTFDAFSFIQFFVLSIPFSVR